MKRLIRWLARVFGADITVEKIVYKERLVTKTRVLTSGRVDGDLDVDGDLFVRGNLNASGEITAYNPPFLWHTQTEEQQTSSVSRTSA